MALIVRESRPQLGAFSLGAALKSVGNALSSSAQQAGQQAIKGAGASLADTVRNAILGPPPPPGAQRPAGATSMVPYIAGGGVAVVLLGYLLLHKRGPA
jgi:hypothetical protein